MYNCEFTKEEYVEWLDYNLLSFDELSKIQKEFLNNLNQELRKIETIIKPEAIHLKEIAERRVSDARDWIEDYEIEYVISFYINKSDPAYKDDNDNILIELNQSIKNIDESFGIGDNKNHNECQYIPNSPIKDENHCYLYHELISHFRLGWANILRISWIWIDIDVVYQTRIDLTKKSKNE